MKLTQKMIKDILDYNPETGIFTWVKGPRKNSIAGTINDRGYLRIQIKHKRYPAHRIAWLFVYGYLPENQIDHINRNKSDNRLCNLREVSKSCNMRNIGNRKDSTSGIKGVGWDKTSKKWKSYICVNNKSKHLGRFVKFEDAVAARFNAEQYFKWDTCETYSPARKYMESIKRL